MRNIFLICPVRGVDEGELEKIKSYVGNLEKSGHKVYWPYRDTNQEDSTGGVRICKDNLKAIKKSSEVHIWYNEESKGSLFDLGIVFSLGKILIIANLESVQPVKGKHFKNVLIDMDKKGREALAFFGVDI